MTYKKNKKKTSSYFIFFNYLGIFLFFIFIFLLMLKGALAIPTEVSNQTGLVAWYQFNNSNLIIDNSGNSIDGTVNGGVVFNSSGHINGSYNFDGSTGVVTTSNNALLDFGSNAFTVEWWENRPSTVNAGTAIARDNTVGVIPYLIGYDDNGGNMLVYMDSGADTWDIASAKSLGPMTYGVWNYFVVKRNSTGLYNYKNGALTASWTSASAIQNGASGLQIGRYQASPSPEYYFIGHMDNLNFYNYSINETAMLNHNASIYGDNATKLVLSYNFDNNVSTWGKDSSGNGNDLTASSGVNFTNNCNFSGCYNFSRASTNFMRRTLPDAMRVPNMTLEAWVNLTTLPGGGQYYTISALVPSAVGGGRGIQMYIEPTAKIYVQYGDTVTWISATGSTSLVAGQWYHIVEIYNDTGIYGYLNGNLDASTANTNDLVMSDGAGNPSPAQLYIGGNSDGTPATDPNIHFFNGYIDSVRFYNRTLTTNEIVQNWNGISPNTAPTVTPINITLVSNNLLGRFTYSDAENDVQVWNQTTWYKWYGSNYIEEADFRNLTTIMGGNLSNGQKWIFSARANDGTSTGAWANSSVYTYTTPEDTTTALNNSLWTLVLFIGLIFLLFILGINLKDFVYTMSSGIISLILSIHIIRTGFPSVTNTFLVLIIWLTLFGLGIYFILKSAYDILEGGFG